MNALNLHPAIAAKLLPNGHRAVVCRNGLTGNGAVVVDVEDGIVTYLAGDKSTKTVELLARPREEFCEKYGTPDAQWCVHATATKLLAEGATITPTAQGWIDHLLETTKPTSGEDTMSKIAPKTTGAKSTKAAPSAKAPAATVKVGKGKATAPVAEEKPAKVGKAKAAKVEETAVEGKRPGRPGYGARGYTVLITENPCRPGFCADQVQALIDSDDLAEAATKLAAKGHTRKLEVSWAVKNGYIALND